jgi:hypothetical protein
MMHHEPTSSLHESDDTMGAGAFSSGETIHPHQQPNHMPSCVRSGMHVKQKYPCSSPSLLPAFKDLPKCHICQGLSSAEEECRFSGS